MAVELQVAWIGALATVGAALIAIVGAVAIFAHRTLVIRLAREVEAYHEHEGWLIEQLIRSEGEEPTAGLVRHRRGVYRREASRDTRPAMTAQEARRVRRRYLSMD